MSYHLRIKIPNLPHLQAANSREHWAKRLREERWWKHQVGWHCKASGLPERPLGRARIVCTRRSTRQPDHDNLVASFKPVIDGLTLCGVITSDHPDVIGSPEYQWVKVPRAEQGVVVEVESI